MQVGAQSLGCYSYSASYHFHKQYIATYNVEAAFYVAIDNAKISSSANSAPLPTLYGIPQPLKSSLTIPTIYLARHFFPYQSSTSHITHQHLPIFRR